MATTLQQVPAETRLTSPFSIVSSLDQTCDKSLISWRQVISDEAVI